MSRRVLGIRRGNSVHERIQIPVQDVPALRLIPTTDVVDKAIITVEDNGLFRFDYEGLGIDDGTSIVEPTTGPGRWFLLAGSFAATLTDTERLPYYFPVAAGVTLEDVSWMWSTLTVIRIDVLVLSAITTAGAYTLAISGAGNNLLNAATEDLLGLTPGVVTELTLTGTALDLQFSDKDIVTITLDSDNADLTGGDAVLIVVYAEETGGGGGGGGGGEDLDATLTLGNFTGTNDILVEDGQALIGEPAAGGSNNPGFDAVVRGGVGDGTGIRGRVFVESVAHVEKALLLNHTPPGDLEIAAPSAGQGFVYVDDGSGSNQVDTPYYKGAGAGNTLSLFGGDVLTTSYAGPGVGTFTLSRPIKAVICPVTAAGILVISLPPAALTEGRIIWFEHTGDGTGVLRAAPGGGDTIDGAGVPVTIPFGTFGALISDGVSDWRFINFPGTVGGVTFGGSLPTAANQVALWTDATGTTVKESTMTVVGNDVDVVGTLTAAVVTAGDLEFKSKERNAYWRIVEHHDYLQVINVLTGKSGRLVIEPDPENDIPPQEFPDERDP